MRIGYLISNYLPKIGGAEAFTHNMATELARQGHYVVVVTPSLGRRFDKSFNYKIERVNPFLTRLLFTNFWLGKLYVERTLSKIQKKHKLDVWQATIGYPLGAAAVDFFNRDRIPSVLRCVGEDIQIYPALRYGYRLKGEADKIVREQYKKFTAVIAASESMKNDFISLGVPADRISMISNGVDCAKFEKVLDREGLRRALGMVGDEKLLLTVGRNHPKKGFEQIVPIARLLSRENIDFKWLLVGKNCSKIKEEADKEGLGSYFISKEVKVQISPSGELEIPNEELLGYYKAADIFVFPTYIELFAKVLIEAMAAGLPIVTTDAPGANEMIEEGVSGLKSRVKDTDGLANSIMKIFNDRELEERLRNGALSASKNYDWATVVCRYAELYKNLSTATKKIKIAHLITDLDIGGTELMLLKVLRNSDKKLYDHLVISLKSEGKVAKGIEALGIRVISLNVKWYNFPLCFMRLCRILRKEKPDIVHNYLFHAEMAGRLCGKMAGVPVIISSLRSVNVGSDLRQFFLKITDGLVNGVTAVSKKVAEEHIGRQTTKKDKIRVIYNGLEVDKAVAMENKNELKRRIGVPLTSYVVLSVGNLRPVKGYSFIFEALEMLLSKGKDVKLLIVGDGSYKRNLEIELQDKGISENVIFAGEKEELSDFLNMADTFVMASLWEGLPNSLLEAMAAGLPIIATKVGGIPEVVDDNENGLLIDPKDSKALAQAIERMISDKEFAMRLSNNAQKFVRDNFGIERTVKDLDSLYTELLKKYGKI